MSFQLKRGVQLVRSHRPWDGTNFQYQIATYTGKEYGWLITHCSEFNIDKTKVNELERMENES